jgi:hypothetical protein
LPLTWCKPKWDWSWNVDGPKQRNRMGGHDTG